MNRTVVSRMGTVALLLAASRAAAGAPADSAAAPPRRVFYQDTVVVEASKLRSRLAELATTATVISPEQIRLGTAPGVHAALAVVPGVHLLDLSGSESQGVVEARGFASQGQSSHMLVLVDEMPINEVESDRVDWNLLGLGQVDRIEFLRGAAAFLYGNATMAGVVNIRTRQPGQGPNAWFEGSGGSYGRRDGAGGFGWGHGRVETGLSGAYQGLDGWREHSAWDAGGGNATLRAALSPSWDLRARVFGHRAEQEVPGPLPDPEWRDDPRRAGTPLDRRDLTAGQGALELRGRARGFELTTALTGDARDLDAIETIIPAGTMNRKSNSRVGRAEMRAHWSALPFGAQALLGGELQQGTLDSRYVDPVFGPAGGGDVRRTSGALFGLLVGRPFAPVTLTGGARVDWLRSHFEDPDGAAPSSEDDLRAVSPTVGLGVPLPRSGSAYLSYARAFKAPTLEQLYDRRPYFVGPPPPIFISNNALQPQRGHHVDAGVRSNLVGSVWTDVSVYWARSTDEIGFDLANFRHINIDKSLHYGVEAQLSAGQGDDLLSWTASYALTRAVFDGGPHDGKQINTVPLHQLYGRLSVRVPGSGSVTLEATHVREQWIDEDETYRLPNYTVADLGVTRVYGPIEMFGTVRNLFDERYATLGYVTVDATFNPLPLYFPAAGRGFRLGARWRRLAGS